MSALPLQDVFISYASADLAVVRPIADALTAEGVSVWRDKDCILGGQEWNGDIEWAITNSRVLVVMCSPSAFRSKNVRKEVSYAWNSAHGNYVPVWVSPPGEFPVGSGFGLFLGSLHRIETVGRPQADWLPELLAALAHHGIVVARPDPAAGEGPPPPATPAPDRLPAASRTDAPLHRPATEYQAAPPEPGPPRRRRVWAVVAACLALATVAVVGWRHYGGRAAAVQRQPNAEPNSPPARPGESVTAPVGKAELKAPAPRRDPPLRTPADRAIASTVWVQAETGSDVRTGVVVDRDGTPLVLIVRRPASARMPVVTFPDHAAGQFITSCEHYTANRARLTADGRIQTAAAVTTLAGQPAELLQAVRLPRAQLPDGVRAVKLAPGGARRGEPVLLCGMHDVSRGSGWRVARGSVSVSADPRLFDFGPGREVRGRAVEHGIAVSAEDAGAPLVNDDGELVGVHFGTRNGVNLAVTAADIAAALARLAADGW